MVYHISMRHTTLYGIESGITTFYCDISYKDLVAQQDHKACVCNYVITLVNWVWTGLNI